MTHHCPALSILKYDDKFNPILFFNLSTFTCMQCDSLSVINCLNYKIYIIYKLIICILFYNIAPQARPCEPDRPFKCTTTGQCIANTLMCNGYEDCTDGSDEDVNICKVRICYS